MERLSPFVYWAQTEKDISLKIDLKNVKDPDVALKSKRLEFRSLGCGAKGTNDYAFALDFHKEVKPQESQFRVKEQEVDFSICKEKEAWWPRLTAQPQKPVWLKIDFDKWKSEDDVDDEEEEKRDVMADFPYAYDRLHKQEFGYRKEEIKKVYLAFYNLCQFVGFLYITGVMSVRYLRDGPESLPSTYEVLGSALKFVQLLQFLEVMHPLFGYTKGGILEPLLQVCGRNFVLFCLLESEPRLQSKPVVAYLFIVWSLIELVRYPYYVTRLYNFEISILTWLRYSMWIPLYPLGFISEGVVMLRSIPYFEETNKFTVTLPNSWNFAFHFPTVVRMYLLLFFFPGIYTMMKHLYHQRTVKLGPNSWKKK